MKTCFLLHKVKRGFGSKQLTKSLWLRPLVLFTALVEAITTSHSVQKENDFNTHCRQNQISSPLDRCHAVHWPMTLSVTSNSHGNHQRRSQQHTHTHSIDNYGARINSTRGPPRTKRLVQGTYMYMYIHLAFSIKT